MSLPSPRLFQFHTERRSQKRHVSHQEKNKRYNSTIETIFAANRAKDLGIATGKFKKAIQGAMKSTQFKCVLYGHKLILSHPATAKVEALRIKLFATFRSHSFKKCVVCDNSLIISCYLPKHAAILQRILSDANLIKGQSVKTSPVFRS